jgi:hypothetical protein
VNSAAPWPIAYRLTGENPPLAREFSSLLTNCGFIQTSGNDAQLTIKFVHSDELAVSDYSGEALVDWRDLKIRKQETRILFSYRSWNLEVDVETATFRCSGPEPAPDERRIFREFFLISPILWTLHRFGYFELHAAAGVHEDFGYLLLGPSGSGKTTTMLSLIASGWNYLSDDAIVVSADPEGGIWARPLRRSFSLKPDHLERHPQLEAYVTESVPGTSKRRLDPRKAWPEQYADMAKPRFIISCKLTDEETTRIIPMSRAESLARLVASTPWLMLDRSMAPVHLEIFRSLAATCCGFELRAGREMFRNRSNITSLIAPEVLRNECRSINKEEAWA